MTRNIFKQVLIAVLYQHVGAAAWAADTAAVKEQSIAGPTSVAI
jgi:hypothetical protein